MKTRDTELTWQIVDYDNYDECKENGETRVYALSPFGSSYLRSYFQTALNIGKKGEVNGGFSKHSHPGADWGGRRRIDEIIQVGKSVSTASTIPQNIYKYELARLGTVYTATDSKNKLDKALNEEFTNMPIVAVAPGRVENVSFSARSGFYVKIQHAPGVYTSYMHLKRWPLVNIGDYVGAGTYLGYEGNTGRSFGKHLHFEVEIAGENFDPVKYIYPTFNPFYNKELAEKDGYSMMSDYMSLYRTVSMVGTNSGKGEIPSASLTNNVPSQYLVRDYNELIQKQGVIERLPSMHGELGWGYNGQYNSSMLYSEHLKSNGIYDLYLKNVFFDQALAAELGYFDVDFELLSILYGNITVKTDLPGALPALTRAELDHILKYWLPARYKSEEKVKWLMDNVFTEENINIMLEVQEKYKVSIVFMLAVAVQEQNIGLSGTELALPPACNIFSIKCGTDVPYIVYQNGKTWRKYGSYGAAFEGFAKLIAESEHYFQADRYTIGTIAPVYCEGNTWGNAVTGHVLDIMKYYIGSGWSFPNVSFMLGADDVIGIARSCMQFYIDNKYKYCQGSAGRLIPPYDANGNVRQNPHSQCSTSGCSAGRAYRSDCSTYVSWVIYEWAKVHGYTDLQEYFDSQITSGGFESIGDALRQGKKDGIYKYFILVAKDFGGKLSNVKHLLQPGDILIYREGSGHHVEILSEKGVYVYTYGYAQDEVEPNSNSDKYTRRSDATYVIRLVNKVN